MPLLTANMGLNVPVLNDPSPGYVNNIIAALQTVDAHDHGPGRGVPVPFASLAPTSDLGFGGFRAQNLLAVQFANQGAAPTTASVLGGIYVQSGNLYYMTPGGVSVQVTNGPSLTLPTLPVIIGGDYGAVGAAINFVNASNTYTFLNGSAAAANLNGAAFIATNDSSFQFPSRIVTYNVATLRGQGNGYTINATTTRLVMTNGVLGQYFLIIPAPPSGTLKALRFYLSASGTVSNVGVNVLTQPSTSGGTASPGNLGTVAADGARSGDFTISLPSLSYSVSNASVVVAQFYWNTSNATPVILTGVQADWQVTALPSTAN